MCSFSGKQHPPLTILQTCYSKTETAVDSFSTCFQPELQICYESKVNFAVVCIVGLF